MVAAILIRLFVMATSELRVGVLVPAGNTVHEAEFARMRPEGVVYRFAPFTSPKGVEPSSFCSLLAENLTAPMKELTDWGAKVLLIGCTSASMKCDDPKAEAWLSEIAGVPVITAASAVREALRFLKKPSLSVATPYSEATNQVVSDFITRQGVKVAGIKGLAFDVSPDVWKAKASTLKAEELLDFSLTIAPDADGLYLPCTGVNSLDALKMYESRTGKLGLSSVQAGYWAVMRHLGVNGQRSDAGQLVQRWN